MSDEGTRLAGVQVESEPEGRCQGKELACHKVYLMRERSYIYNVMIISRYWFTVCWITTLTESSLHFWNTVYPKGIDCRNLPLEGPHPKQQQ